MSKFRGYLGFVFRIDNRLSLGSSLLHVLVHDLVALGEEAANEAVDIFMEL